MSKQLILANLQEICGCGCHGNVKNDRHKWYFKISAQDEWTATESFSTLEWIVYILGAGAGIHHTLYVRGVSQASVTASLIFTMVHAKKDADFADRKLKLLWLCINFSWKTVILSSLEQELESKRYMLAQQRERLSISFKQVDFRQTLQQQETFSSLNPLKGAQSRLNGLKSLA